MSLLSDKRPSLDEGVWAYLSLGGIEVHERSSHHRVIDACQECGWPAVGWSPPLRHDLDSYEADRFFEGMEHAVRYADVFVAVLTGPSEIADKELELALRHRRPVVALLLGDECRDSAAAGLRDYDRGRWIDCADLDDCIGRLREVLTDPAFIATIDEAATGSPAHV